MQSGSNNARLLMQATTHTCSRLITCYFAKTLAMLGMFLHTAHSTSALAASFRITSCHSAKYGYGSDYSCLA